VPAILGGALDIHVIRENDPEHANGGRPVSTGRRLALARWLVDARNPLTARVAVNHLWARHFGRGLVDNPADFGVRCPRPLHQDLLDWLATEFQAHGWSMRHLHRLILTSNLYRMQSSDQGADERTRTADPENRYWWRMDARRMESEVVRDSLLYLAGNLDPTLGGPSLPYPQGHGRERRSMYYRYSREDKMEFLTVFDAANTEECYRRDESVVPQQALALVNDDWVWHQARCLTHRLGTGDRPDFVTRAFETVLSRPPTLQEQEATADFLRRLEKCLAGPANLVGPPALDPEQQVREYLVHALLNHNDFVTVR
jgi:hypothetical protein